VPLLLPPLGLNPVAVLSCLLCNITLSEKSGQADTAATVRQQPGASGGGGDAHVSLKRAEAIVARGIRPEGELRLFGQTGMPRQGGCQLLH